MWVADMDLPAPEAVIESLHKRLEHPYLGYGMVQPDFYESFSGWAKRRQGWNPVPEWLEFIPSVMAGLRLAVDEFSSPGDGVIVPSPVYHPFLEVPGHRGRKRVDWYLQFSHSDGQYHMDIDRLRELAELKENSVLLLCNPHNPLGKVWSPEELAELLEVCIENDVAVISDEIHADLVYSGGTFTPLIPVLREMDPAHPAVSIQSPSKTFNIPGIASALYISSSRDLLKRLRARAAAWGHELPNVLALEAATAAYRHGDGWMDETLALLESNRNVVTDFVDQTISPLGLEESPVPMGTYLYWLDLRQGERIKGIHGVDSYRNLKKQAGLWLSPGYQFSPEDSSHGSGFFRMNFACPRQLLNEGLSRLEKWLEE
ncbi:Cystathionine beta-lyase, Bsu PatB [Salinispira pacifica]|uniref:cysteine-S-conjugate beta-lyase n=2 Tax=Salinispira pacifica TaxID=1307761 RepID=V5WL23_9SPIO|nr:Cystathionine beta-lyase, Bsu PatB [Salinispira pacifica]